MCHTEWITSGPGCMQQCGRSRLTPLTGSTLHGGFTCKTVVLIQKLNGNYQGIGLVEFLWNTVMVILNLRLKMAIQLHDTLHGFHTGRCTRIASLEAKLLQHPMAMREEVLYEIVLDLHKAYGALDCSSCL